ncbi:TIGR04211 family SH3 domain-containing protein [Pseudoalteromonas sp. T1lg65]|uniref:TIGR04211 family SH3 domain-containing protein n=1 Tax=Pseudoalteromonas sp. T1lg65 TaxID=2077101 RepID=UPI003F7B226C
MFNIKQIVIASLFLATLPVVAEEPVETVASEEVEQQLQPNGYISDDLYIFMHTGPGKNYRILGSVNAGSRITILSGAEDGFIQIKDDKDREGWIESDFATTEPGLRQQLDALNQTLSDTQQQLTTTEQQLPELQQANNELRAENSNLNETIASLEQQLAEEKSVKQQKVDKERHLLLGYGGAIALGSLVIGVILTLTLSRRKRYDGW